MSRLQNRFAELKQENRAALVTFVTAGDPDYATSLSILKGLPDAGADVIELGMPFTDPMADGPAIQLANIRALAEAFKRAPKLPRDHLMVINLSGRGDKDMQTVMHHMGEQEKHA